MCTARSLFCVVLGLAVAICPTPLVHAETDATSPMDVSDESILFMEIPSVFGASKYEQKVTEAPSSVSIVTAGEIRKYGYRTLADILQSVRGFYTAYDRNYHYLGVRGFNRPGDYISRVLILVDGHRINDNIYDGGTIGTDFFLDVDLIERVEVIPGPSSSLYGTNAFFGVVNVITRKGRALKGVEVSGEVGSFDTYKARLTYGNRFANGLEMMFSGTYYDSEGPEHLYFKEFDDPSTNYGIATDCDDDQAYSFFSTLSFHDFTLAGGYISREKGMPPAPWGIEFNDPQNRTWDRRGYADLTYAHSFTNEIAVKGRLFYDHQDYDGDYVYDYADPGDPPDIVMGKDSSEGNWWGMDVNATAWLMEKYNFIVGAEYEDNFQQDQTYYDEEPFYSYLDEQRSGRNYAFYGQGEGPLVLENLILNVGVRYDHYDTFGGTTNPRVALIYEPFERTNLKFLYGQAFRAPNAYELYYGDGGESQKGNTDLEPETIQTFELTWEQRYSKYFRSVVSGFYYEIDDLINQVEDPIDELLVFENLDEVEARGVELELERKGPDGWEGRISYTYQRAEEKETGRVLTNSPEHLVKLNLIAPIVRDKFFAGIEVQYASKTKTLAEEYADDYVVTNLTFFSENILEGLEFSASVYNLFDQGYGYPAAGEFEQDILEQDGRTFRVKLTYAF